MDPETFAIGHGNPLSETPWEHQLQRQETTGARRKPLHVRKGDMHAYKIREPRDAKRWTLVGLGYYLGIRPSIYIDRLHTTCRTISMSSNETRLLYY
jgi:hypothetical protein